MSILIILMMISSCSYSAPTRPVGSKSRTMVEVIEYDQILEVHGKKRYGFYDEYKVFTHESEGVKVRCYYRDFLDQSGLSCIRI